MKAPRQIEVIMLRAAPAAQHLEIKPHHTTGTPAQRDHPTFYIQLMMLVFDLGHGIENLAQPCV